jgi:Serine dehydrogenase proteinase
MTPTNRQSLLTVSQASREYASNNVLSRRQGTNDTRGYGNLDNEFQRHGCRRNTNKIGQLDVLLHTFGGDAHMGYMLAQILRDYADYINFLIPFHAASAGTLTCFSADKILFGGYAYLTPIDTSIGNFSLMSIDYFREFAIECRLRMEGQFKTWEINDAESRVESDLLLEMVKQVSAIDVGNLYRQRTLTAYYADLLLSTYMFNNHPEAQTIGRNIASTVVFQYPSHEFFLDYHMCKKLGLVVDELSYTESDLAKALVQLLDKFTMNGIICKEVGKGYRMPFITLYEKER